MAEIIFIVGPTATGKTETAIALAGSIGAEIVSCDSMVVYQEAGIVTSKPSREMLARVKHHFVDIISVTQEYSVFDYYQNATLAIQELILQKKPVIVCGGSGLYARALLDGIFAGAGKDESIRAQLTERIAKEGNASVYRELQAIDPVAAEKISINDTKRIVRALEVYYSSGEKISEKRKETKGIYGAYPVQIFGLTCDRACLYERINARVDSMIEAGAVEEVKKLLQLPLSLTASKIIGVKEIGGFIKGEYDIERAREDMKRKTRQFAKRQVTWFKPDKRIVWLDVEGRNSNELCDQILKSR